MLDEPVPIFWKGADRGALLLQDQSAQNGRARAWRVDLASGTVTEDAIAIVTPPRGFPSPSPEFQRFANSGYTSIPLLRAEFKGTEDERWTPQWDPFRGGLKSGSITIAEGTWRVTFGGRQLLERSLRNSQFLPRIEDVVSLDPDGRFLVCTCADSGGTWIAVYDINTLTRGAAVGAPLPEKP